MRYIVVGDPVPPRKLTALNRRIVEVSNLPAIADKKAYLAKTNTWGLLKKWLSSFSHGKCWYCECITERATSDVDHFRPKAGVTVNRKPVLGHNGYYWLAYDWTNFRFSCQRCNRSEKDDDTILYGKANEFALFDESTRRNTQASTTIEEPLLLDPCNEPDIDLLAHLLDGTIAPSRKKGTKDYKKATYTINTFGLNGFGVPKKKLKQWQTLNLLVNAIGHIEQPAVTDNLKNYISDDAEYSKYFHSALCSHRDKNWVDDIL